ncbi:MAG: NAD(P)-dependent oxidoreductase [Thiobacillaceae bacterium]
MVKRSASVALVTGATGFIGGHLAQQLLDQGWTVKVLARDPLKLGPSLRSMCEVIVADICDEGALRRAVRQTDVVFHCAANVSTWDRGDAYYAVNVLGVKNLLNAIVMENAALLRLVHLSTVDVYGFPVAPCNEQCTTSGSGFGYGETKLQGESLVREYCEKYHIQYTILRPANVIGPGSQFISRIGDGLKSGVMLTVDGGRTNAGMLYVGNLVDYLIWAAQAESSINKIYNVRDNYDVDWLTFIKRFRASIEGRGVVINLPFAMADAIAYGMEAVYRRVAPSREPLLHRLLVRFFGRTCGHDAEKIRFESGYAGRVGFDEAMDRSVSWFLGRTPA